MVPERHGGHDGSDDRSRDARGPTPDAREGSEAPETALDAPETTVVAAPDSWKTGVPEGTAGADPSGPLRRLGVAPEAAALGRPSDQRRLRDRMDEGGVG